MRVASKNLLGRHSPLKLRNVIEYRSASTPGMLCSHSLRDGPESRYADRGSATIERRSHLLPSLRRRRKAQDDRREIPTTSPNTERSLCHPIWTPGLYSVSRTCCSCSGGNSANR